MGFNFVIHLYVYLSLYPGPFPMGVHRRKKYNLKVVFVIHKSVGVVSFCSSGPGSLWIWYGSATLLFRPVIVWFEFGFRESSVSRVRVINGSGTKIKLCRNIIQILTWSCKIFVWIKLFCPPLCKHRKCKRYFLSNLD